MATGATFSKPSGRRTIQMNSFGISAQLTGKPSPSETITTEENTVSYGDGNVFPSFLGAPVAGVIGRKLISNPNVIWTGNLKPIVTTTIDRTTETEIIDGETVTTTKTVTTTAIVGYTVDIHLGIALGPGTKLVGIYNNNEPIWTGNIGPARTEGTITGGNNFIKGTPFVFSGGNFDQAPEPYVSALVADYPGYVGVATVLLRGVRADVDLGQWSFEVTRAPNPLGLSDANNKLGDDINVISATVEVITNEWGWGGLDISSVDTTKMSALAVIVKNEGNFCSIKIEEETSTAAVLKALQDQAASIIFQDPETGLVTTNLVRLSELSYLTTPRFNLSNTSELRNFQKTYWPDTVEQAQGLFTERDSRYTTVPVYLQNSANMNQSGRGRRTAVIQYPFVATRVLAQDLLARDFGVLVAPIFGFELLTNRDGATLVPGTLAMVTWAPHDLLNVPVLVLTVRKNDIKNNNVTLKVRQIKFPDTTPLFGSGGDPYDPGFNVSPVAPLAVTFYSAPYFFARSGMGLNSSQTAPIVAPLVLPKPANALQYSFTALIENMPSTSGDTTVIDNSLYPTYSELVTPIGLYDDTTDGIIASVTIDTVTNDTQLVDVGNAGVRAGSLFILCGNEIMSCEGVTDNGDGTWTLTNVHRGLLDTVASAHAANDPVYVIGNNFRNIPTTEFSYPLGFVPDWTIVSNSPTEEGVKGDHSIDSSAWVPSEVRVLAPPRPHNTKINGAARSSSPVALVIGASTTVTWATRSRLVGTVRLQLDAADAPEVSGASTQTHRILARDSANVLHDLGTTVGNTDTFNWPAMATGAGYLYVQAEITIGGNAYISLQQDRIPITVS